MECPHSPISPRASGPLRSTASPSLQHSGSGRPPSAGCLPMGERLPDCPRHVAVCLLELLEPLKDLLAADGQAGPRARNRGVKTAPPRQTLLHHVAEQVGGDAIIVAPVSRPTDPLQNRALLQQPGIG